VSICVVYLAYLPYGPEMVERFLASYEEHPAGLDHELLIALKGAGEAPDVNGATRIVPDDGLDLASYLWIARETAADRYLFLNTSSVILDGGWLKKLDRHLGGKVGIVGATGSHGASCDKTRAYPNPHIRTTAFMLERDLMLDLDWHEPILTKDDAYAAENGARSITTQILERDLQALVVGRDGKGYPVDRWYESRTFWSHDQGNLLIADNGVLNYPVGNYRVQRARSLSAWNQWTPTR
jgi:hypothetical protein